MGNKKKKRNFYVVVNGVQPGIYHTWEECSAQVTGFPNAKYQGFSNINVAMEFQSKNLKDKCATVLTHEYQLQTTYLNTASVTVSTQWPNSAEYQNAGLMQYSYGTLPDTNINKHWEINYVFKNPKTTY